MRRSPQRQETGRTRFSWQAPVDVTPCQRWTRSPSNSTTMTVAIGSRIGRSTFRNVRPFCTVVFTGAPSASWYARFTAFFIAGSGNGARAYQLADGREVELARLRRHAPLGLRINQRIATHILESLRAR